MFHKCFPNFYCSEPMFTLNQKKAKSISLKWKELLLHFQVLMGLLPAGNAILEIKQDKTILYRWHNFVICF